MAQPSAASSLVWTRPERLSEHFELRGADGPIATLTFDPRPTVAWEYTARHEATAAAGDARWRLAVVRRGFLGLKADVHVGGTNEGMLGAGYFLRNAIVDVSGLPPYSWDGSVTRNSSDVFVHPEGFPALRFEHGEYFDRVNAHVTVLFDAMPPRDVVLLATLGLYLRLLMNKVYR